MADAQPSGEPQGRPAFLEPTLRIFLSVDIVGSTNFKQLIAAKAPEEPKPSGAEGAYHPGKKWLDPILQFYDQMAARFAHEWNMLAEAAEREFHWSVGNPPRLWKAVGDELIFSKALGAHQEAYVCVAAMLKTVQGFRSTIKAHSSGLDLKCAAWIAGFPVNNAEVVLSSNATDPAIYDDGDFIFANLSRLHDTRDDASAIRDYIGPSIDTGFRVASLASPRRFVLTVDLALLLSAVSSATPATAKSITPFSYYYHGRESLKGVTNGVPYPVFWIDSAASSPLKDIEDRLEGLTPVDASSVKEYCERYIERHEGSHIIRPYMVNDSDHLFKHMPEDHKSKLAALGHYWHLEQEKRRVEQQAAEVEPTCGDSPAADTDVPSPIEDVRKVITTLKNRPDPKGPLFDAISKYLDAQDSTVGAALKELSLDAGAGAETPSRETDGPDPKKCP